MVKTFVVVVDAMTLAAFQSAMGSVGVTPVEVSQDVAMELLAKTLSATMTPKAPPPPRQRRAISNTRLRAVSGAHHSWAHEGPGLDRCAKCGMLREHLEKGVLSFMDRNGRIMERPPFGDPTPRCDEALARRSYLTRSTG